MAYNGKGQFRRRGPDPVLMAEIPVPTADELIELTEKQRKFAELYITHQHEKTLSEISQEAGYAYNAGTSMLRHPPVARYIKRLRADIAPKYEVTFENHVRKLAEIRDIALQNGAYAAAVAAEKHRGAVAGLYVDRKEIKFGLVEQMSKDEVLKEIQKLKDEYPALSAVWDTNKVIEHQPTIGSDNGDTPGEQVQPEVREGNEG
jgi:phage terminase small subunit